MELKNSLGEAAVAVIAYAIHPAHNISGETINSFFCIDNNRIRNNDKLNRRLKETQVLIIDEGLYFA